MCFVHISLCLLGRDVRDGGRYGCASSRLLTQHLQLGWTSSCLVFVFVFALVFLSSYVVTPELVDRFQMNDGILLKAWVFENFFYEFMVEMVEGVYTAKSCCEMGEKCHWLGWCDEERMNNGVR